MNRLRPFLSFALICSALFFASCDEDKDPTPKDLIIGTWNVTNSSVDITINGQPLVAYFVSLGFTTAEAQAFADQLSESNGEDLSGTIEFKTDGTYRSTDDSGGDPSTGKWELSADSKTLTTDKGTADETVFSVTTLTSNKLNLSASVEEEDGGFTLAIKLDLELTK